MTESNPGADSKPSRAEASRQRRSARAIAAERQRKQTATRTVAIAIATIALVAIVGFVLFNRQQASVAVPDGIQDFAYQGAQHSEAPVAYSEHPPAGGVHNPVWQNCGYYAAPIPSETAVHSLEHGAVWITYQPDLPEAEVKALDKLADTRFVLVSPYPGLEDPIVASVWGAQLRLDAADDPRLGAFIERFAGNGPEPGASCDSGLETTVEDAG